MKYIKNWPILLFTFRDSFHFITAKEYIESRWSNVVLVHLSSEGKRSKCCHLDRLSLKTLSILSFYRIKDLFEFGFIVRFWSHKWNTCRFGSLSSRMLYGKKKLVCILLWSKYCEVDCPWNYANFLKGRSVGKNENRQTIFTDSLLCGGYYFIYHSLSRTVHHCEWKYRYFVYNNDSWCKKNLIFFLKNYNLLFALYSWNLAAQLEIAVFIGVTISWAIVL